MARTTKIPCEGAIYTVHSDAYGTVTEVDMGAGAEAPPKSDEAVEEERARYAQLIRELVVFEEAVVEDEELSFLAEDVGGEDGDSPDLSQ